MCKKGFAIAAFASLLSFAGAESMVPGVPVPVDEEMNQAQGYPTWSGDCFWAFDGDTSTFPNNITSNLLKFDAGVARSISKIKLLPWNNSAANGRYNNLAIYGSADGLTWDKLVDNGGQAQNISTWFEYTPENGESFGSYRYFEIRNCYLGWAKEVEFYSNDLMVETYRPRVWGELDNRTLGAADDADGVYLSGKLINVAGADDNVVLYVATKDCGTNEQDWIENGAVYEIDDIAADGKWSTKIKLNRGLWYVRAFAKSGAISSASQRTESFLVDSTPLYPVGYSNYGSSRANLMYDGSTDTCGDSANAGKFPLILDVRNLSDSNGKQVWPASVKMWSAKSAQALYLAWTWSRGTIIDATWDDLDLSMETLNTSVKGRTVYTCTLPSANWVRITDASGFIEKNGPVYEMTLPKSFKANPPKYLRVRGAPLNYVAELEIRTLPLIDGLVIIVK